MVQAAVRPKVPIDLMQSPYLYSDKNSRSKGSHSPAPWAPRSANLLHPHLWRWFTAELKVPLRTEGHSLLAGDRWASCRQLNPSHVLQHGIEKAESLAKTGNTQPQLSKWR